MFGVLATGFAVLLGFFAFLAFESFDTSRSGGENEAQIVAEQFETAQLMPVAVRGHQRLGKKKWNEAVVETIERLAVALEPDSVVLGGGNAKKLGELPPNVQLGANNNAFIGAFVSGIPITPTAHRPDVASAENLGKDVTTTKRSGWVRVGLTTLRQSEARKPAGEERR